MGRTVDGWELLANAIIVEAARDFRAGYRRLKKDPGDRQAQDTVRESTRFFHSQFYEYLTNVDGPGLIQKMMKEIDSRYEKRRPA